MSLLNFDNINEQYNNEQYKVPARFEELRMREKKKKDDLRIFLLKECCYLLPEELWDIILDMMIVKSSSSVVGYFAFKRRDRFYNDDHYLFKGTEQDWLLAINKMRSIVSPTDLADDIPTDTYCSSICEILALEQGTPFPCPDEFGNKCECRWTHRVFETVEDYDRYFTMNKENIFLKTYNISEDGVLQSLS